jgi:hypothetical protein
MVDWLCRNASFYLNLRGVATPLTIIASAVFSAGVYLGSTRMQQLSLIATGFAMGSPTVVPRGFFLLLRFTPI